MHSFHDFIQKHRQSLIDTLQVDMDYARKLSPIGLTRDALSQIADTATAGKMIRGHLVLLSAQLHGVPLTKSVYHTAAAVELLHTGLLIHDDIIDNDDQRRGSDSTFHYYQKKGMRLHTDNPLLYGQSMALCVGDILFFLAIEILTRVIHDPVCARRIISFIAQEMQLVGAAEMVDTHLGQINAEATQRDIEEVNLYKTARYTFSLPLMIGALFQKEKADPLLFQLGAHLGIIFQLKDDELGIFGTEKEIGKPVGSDIRENKKTLLRHLLFQAVTPVEKIKLQRLFGKKDLSASDIRVVRTAIQTSGVMTKLQQKIDRHAKAAKTIIAKLKKEGMNTTLLASLQAYNLRRTA